MLAGLVGTALLGLAAKFLHSAWARSLAEKVLAKGIEIAYHAVEDKAKQTPNTIDDKAALALKYLAEYLGSHGLELTEEQVARAKLTFSAIHAQSKAADK